MYNKIDYALPEKVPDFFRKGDDMERVGDHACVVGEERNSRRRGGIAQLARACGSYPQCREFKSPFRY